MLARGYNYLAMSQKTALDLAYLREAIQVLREYLFSSELYWSLASPGISALPNLTLSNVTLAYVRLAAMPLEAPEAAELRRIENQLEALYGSWRLAWGRKAGADFRARLTLWRNFIEDYREQPETQVDRYAYEVRRRVQLHLLRFPPPGWPGAEVPAAELDLLKGLDATLRAVFEPGSFVWEVGLAPAFPADTYWYLYGKPKES